MRSRLLPAVTDVKRGLPQPGAPARVTGGNNRGDRVSVTDLRQADPVGSPLDAFGAVDRTAPYGVQLRQVQTAAEAFRRDLLGTGQPTSVSTHDLVTLPYPTRFGLWMAAV